MVECFNLRAIGLRSTFCAAECVVVLEGDVGRGLTETLLVGCLVCVG